MDEVVEVAGARGWASDGKEVIREWTDGPMRRFLSFGVSLTEVWQLNCTTRINPPIRRHTALLVLRGVRQSVTIPQLQKIDSVAPADQGALMVHWGITLQSLQCT
jgi:hypothetical protein